MQNKKQILLAGASGLVGSALLKQLLADESVARVHALVRRPLSAKNEKLQEHIVDFAALPDLQTLTGPIDECYIALGTTIKVAGSREAFRKVDFDAVVNTARAAQTAGCSKLAVVSALEAKAQSPIFYSRVKGEMEDALRAMNFATLVIARPSILDGDRDALGQPHRFGEDLGLKLMKALGSLIPIAYRPITGSSIAHALITTLRSGVKGVQMLTSGQMQKIGLPSEN